MVGVVGWASGWVSVVDLFGGIAAPNQGSQQQAGGVGLFAPMVRIDRLRSESEAPAGPAWPVTHFQRRVHNLLVRTTSGGCQNY